MHRSTRAKRAAHSSASFPPENATPGSTSASTPPDPSLTPEKKLHEDSLRVLELMDTLGISLGALIEGIFYGNPESRDHLKMRAARASLIHTDKFHTLLNNLYDPPRAPTGGGHKATRAHNVLLEFASTTMKETFARELSTFSDSYQTTKEELADFDELAKITSERLDWKRRAINPVAL